MCELERLQRKSAVLPVRGARCDDEHRVRSSHTSEMLVANKRQPALQPKQKRLRVVAAEVLHFRDAAAARVRGPPPPRRRAAPEEPRRGRPVHGRLVDPHGARPAAPRRPRPQFQAAEDARVPRRGREGPRRLGLRRPLRPADARRRRRPGAGPGASGAAERLDGPVRRGAAVLPRLVRRHRRRPGGPGRRLRERLLPLGPGAQGVGGRPAQNVVRAAVARDHQRQGRGARRDLAGRGRRARGRADALRADGARHRREPGLRGGHRVRGGRQDGAGGATQSHLHGHRRVHRRAAALLALGLPRAGQRPVAATMFERC